MLSRIRDKISSTKGSDKGIVLVGLIVSFALVVYLIISRNNQIFSNQIESFKEGLQIGAKGALLQIDRSIEKNIDNIATGYIIEGDNAQEGYNHELKLNHRHSNNVALKLLSRETGFALEKLREHFKTTIIEPERQKGTINNYRFVATFYNLSNGNSYNKITPYIDFTNSNAINNQITEIENWINSLLKSDDSNMSIKLASMKEGFYREMEVKTYFLSAIDGFNPQPQMEEVYKEEANKYKLINLYHFEGANLMRSTDFRDKQ